MSDYERGPQDVETVADRGGVMMYQFNRSIVVWVKDEDGPKDGQVWRQGKYLIMNSATHARFIERFSLKRS